jgi:hypothetical protein
MRDYSCTIEDDKSLNERTLRHPKMKPQVQADVGGVGTRKGIELGWSQGFGLDESDDQ